MTKYTSKIKSNMEEFFKALKLLFDDKVNLLRKNKSQHKINKNNKKIIFL